MRSLEVILYMALRSIFPSCSMYTGRPSWRESALYLTIEHSFQYYLVGFVVVLRVVLEDLGLLLVTEIPDQVVDLKFFPPFLTIDEPTRVSINDCIVESEGHLHLLCHCDIEFPCPKKSKLPMASQQLKDWSIAYSNRPTMHSVSSLSVYPACSNCVRS